MSASTGWPLPETVAFQGELGAYSHQACIAARPDCTVLPCGTFEGAVAAVKSGRASLAVLPVENSIYGRVADIHRLIPESDLFIVDEVFIRVHINVLGIPGSGLSQVKLALSHMVLLGQCRDFIKSRDLKTLAWADTAGAAKHVADAGDASQVALASELAGDIYGLEVLARNIEDADNNRTRFFLMSGERNFEPRGTEMITAFVFRVRNIPASLYKALGGFATNRVNMLKLESYMVGGSFSATQFFSEIQGHPDDANVALALEELSFFTTSVDILGTYPASLPRS